MADTQKYIVNLPNKIYGISTTGIAKVMTAIWSEVVAIVSFVSANNTHSIGLKSDGKLYGFAGNEYGQIGDNSITYRGTPVAVLGATKTFCKIDGGLYHSLGIDKNGQAWGWGYNRNGQLGDNSITSRRTPVAVLGATKTFCQIAGSQWASLGIDKNGQVWGWGNINSLPLGRFILPSISIVSTPVNVNGTKTFCRICGGYMNSIGIDKNGKAWGWGYNNNGQLGDNSSTSRMTPVDVLGATKTFCQIAAGTYHSLGLDKYGKAWSWGYNHKGQLGDNSLTSTMTPVAVLGATKTFCQISGGQYHSFGLDKNGKAWGWGYNAYGQLGDNSITSRRTPVSVLGATKTFCKIYARFYYSLGIDKNGQAWGWGYNNYGQLGDNSITSRRTPVSVLGATKTFCQISGYRYHSLGLDKNGQAWSWGYNVYGQLGDNSVVSRLTPVAVLGATKTFCQISCGEYHSLVLDKNGKAWSCGSNGYGQLGDNSQTSRRTPVAVLGATKTFCQINVGDNHSFGIDINGKAWSWGYNGSGPSGQLGTIVFYTTPTQISLSPIDFISSGDSTFSLALKTSGMLYAWGTNTYGQLGDNSITNRNTPVAVLGATKTFCKIAAMSNHSLGIDKNGKAWGWGYNPHGQLGDNSITSRRTPVAVLGATKTFCQIAGSQWASLGIDKNGKAWGWGSNTYRQIGDNSTTSRRTPVAVLGATKTFCQISVGLQIVLAVDKNGKAWGWGNISQLGLGLESLSSAITPVNVNGTKTFCQIIGGDNHSLGIDKNGKAWSWGGNNYGQLGNNSTSLVSTPVAVLGATKTFCQINGGMYLHSLGIDKNGKAWSWGYNADGQLGDNSITSRRTPVAVLGATKTFCKISGGYYHSLGIDKNGQAWGWGRNLYGQLGDNSQTSRRTPVAVLGATKTFCQINGAYFHSLGIDKDGKAWGWGYNNNGQLGDNSITSRVTPVAVLGATKTFCQISGGQYHSFGLDKNGKAWSWGYNNYGQLGDNSVVSRRTPVAVLGATKTFCQISTGNYHSLVIDKDGKAWSWGANNVGQLGDNSRTSRRTPVAVLGSTKTFCQITAENSYSLGIDKNGKAWGWGSNTAGQLGFNQYYQTPVSLTI